jgi:hypothetical protein
MSRMNLGQRIVGVVALAAILWFVGAYLTAPVPFTGWVGYAPLSDGTFSRLVVARDGLVPVANLFVWFGLVLGWFAGALLMLRSPMRAARLQRSAGPGAGEGRIAEGEDPAV